MPGLCRRTPALLPKHAALPPHPWSAHSLNNSQTLKQSAHMFVPFHTLPGCPPFSAWSGHPHCVLASRGCHTDAMGRAGCDPDTSDFAIPALPPTTLPPLDREMQRVILKPGPVEAASHGSVSPHPPCLRSTASCCHRASAGPYHLWRHHPWCPKRPEAGRPHSHQDSQA